MLKTVLKKIPDEELYCSNFEDEYFAEEDVEKKILVYGNRDFREYGDSTLLDVVKGNYYDDDIDPATGEAIGYDYETLPELQKLTGKEWAEYEFKGYSQGDWQDVYYVKDEVSQKRLEYLDAYYMGKYSEYRVFENIGGDPQDVDDSEFDYSVYVTHDTEWDGKEAICKELGFDPATTVILQDDGYQRVYKYKELD